ncbi:type II toxin-antitoxin system VapC family toxin [candidate division WOR-3 bacterium]|nr:type II toxin-antitoxin system VapC family toxin [candidate division WOR-3 bacterium]
MKLLLDTHVFLWFVSGDERLSRRARRAIEASDAEPVLSAASVWEMAIKAGLGKLTLPASVEEYVGGKLYEGFSMLPVDWHHAAAVEHLPRHHRDPFDRLIAAQALAEKLPLVSSDSVFRRYGVRVVW